MRQACGGTGFRLTRNANEAKRGPAAILCLYDSEHRSLSFAFTAAVKRRAVWTMMNFDALVSPAGADKLMSRKD